MKRTHVTGTFAGWLFGLALVAGITGCSDDDSTGPVDISEVRVANNLAGVTVNANQQIDSVIAYGLTAGGTAYGTVRPGDTTVFRAVTIVDNTVAVEADSLVIFHTTCTGTGGNRTCTQTRAVWQSVGPYLLTAASASRTTIILDTNAISLASVFTQQTQVRVNNQLVSIPLSSNTADSVHAYGVRVGNVSFGTVRAGIVTAYQNATQTGSQNLMLDSLVVVRAANRQTIRTVPAVSVTILQSQPNTVTITASTYNLDSLLGGTPQQTQVRVSNLLVNVPLTNGTADSVHAYGLRVGILSYGTVRAGMTTSFQTATQSGSQNLTVDSLVIVQAANRQTLRNITTRQVTITQGQQNTVSITTSVYDIDSLLGGSTPGNTQVRIRNALKDCMVLSDSIQTVELYGARIGSVSFGNIMPVTTTTAQTVSPVGGFVTLKFDSLVYYDVICVAPGVCFDQRNPRCVDSLRISVQSGALNTIDFSPGSALTTQLWNARKVTCQ